MGEGSYLQKSRSLCVDKQASPGVPPYLGVSPQTQSTSAFTALQEQGGVPETVVWGCSLATGSKMVSLNKMTLLRPSIGGLSVLCSTLSSNSYNLSAFSSSMVPESLEGAYTLTLSCRALGCYSTTAIHSPSVSVYSQKDTHTDCSTWILYFGAKTPTNVQKSHIYLTDQFFSLSWDKWFVVILASLSGMYTQ